MPEDEYIEVVNGLTQKEWEEIDLSDIDLQDLSFQYRFPSNIGDIRSSLEAEGQLDPKQAQGARTNARRPHRTVFAPRS